MKLIPVLLTFGMLAVSGCSKEDQMWATGEVITSAFRYACRYTPELVKKAEAGDAEAQNTLGMSYLMGSGITQDPKKAVTWFKKSAEQGSASAQCSLAACYSSGIGADIDEEKAVKWYAKAAKQGNEDAKEALEKIKAKQ
jgi:TPR repeat protein